MNSEASCGCFCEASAQVEGTLTVATVMPGGWGKRLGFSSIAITAAQKEPPAGRDVVPDSWTKNWGPSVWDINGREQLKLES